MSSTNDAMEGRRKREMPSIKTLPGGQKESVGQANRRRGTKLVESLGNCAGNLVRQHIDNFWTSANRRRHRSLKSCWRLSAAQCCVAGPRLADHLGGLSVRLDLDADADAVIALDINDRRRTRNTAGNTHELKLAVSALWPV